MRPTIRNCTQTVPQCFEWFLSLGWGERILVMLAIFIVLFIVLRIVFWICTWFE